MILKEYKETYEDFSSKLSDITRNLSFMGFGVVWILIGGLDGFKRSDIPIAIEWIIGSLVLSLLFDLIHYIYQTIVWYCYFNYLENRFGSKFNKKVPAPKRFNKWSWLIFWLKIITMFISYILLLRYIILLVL